MQKLALSAALAMTFAPTHFLSHKPKNGKADFLLEKDSEARKSAAEAKREKRRQRNLKTPV